jgi:undecaprenyl-diphosphatase
VLGWDRRLESWIAGHRVSALDPIFRWLTYIGVDGVVWLVLAAAVALVARRWQVLLWVAAADLIAQLSTDLFKLVIHRSRPRVPTLVAEPHSHSFPSGHAASSFACAVILAAFVPRARIAFYVLAALIAFSRAYVGVHYPLDVIVGAFWGVAIGVVLLEVAERVTGRSRSSSGSRETPSSRESP